MTGRRLVGVFFALAFVASIVFAWRHGYFGDAELLFDSMWWLVALAPFVGLLCAGLTRRAEPKIDGDKIVRHDTAARIEHWTHGIGTAILLVSGIALGLFFTPSPLTSAESAHGMMNVHFVAVILFLFGTFYYFGNTLLSSYRFKEHLPTKNAIEYTKQHYGHLLGIKKYKMPPESKYFESERMAYILALVATVLVILTGFVKAAAHVINVSAWLTGASTAVHDVSTVLMLLFFLAHVFFAAIAPGSRAMLRAMITGYSDVEQVQKEHAGWYEELLAKQEPGAAAAASDD